MDLFDKPYRSSWWVFFPLTGLRVDSTCDTLDLHLFEGATIISFHHLDALLSSPDDEDEHNLRRGMSFGPSHLDPQTAVIAVRQSGLINTHPKVADLFLERIAIEARRRARQIAALLTVVLLVESPHGETCGLLDQVLVREEHLAMIEAARTYQSVSVGYETAARIGSGNYEEPQLSRNQLQQLLELPHLVGLTQAITKTRSIYSKSLRDSIRQACVRLADAALATSYSVQLLGAVTSMEILLSGEGSGEGFEQLQRRLTQLLGTELAARYQLAGVFAARHRYVHRGEEIEQRSQALRALLLALQALLLYTHLAMQVKTKNGVLHYLDLTHIAQKLRGEWPDEHQVLSHTLLSLLNSEQSLPFQSFVDGAIETEEMIALELAMYFEEES